MWKRIGEGVGVLFVMVAMALLVMPMLTMIHNPHLSKWDVFNLWMSKYTFYIPIEWNPWL